MGKRAARILGAAVTAVLLLLVTMGAARLVGQARVSMPGSGRIMIGSTTWSGYNTLTNALYTDAAEVVNLERIEIMMTFTPDADLATGAKRLFIRPSNSSGSPFTDAVYTVSSQGLCEDGSSVSHALSATAQPFLWDYSLGVTNYKINDADAEPAVLHAVMTNLTSAPHITGTLSWDSEGETACPGCTNTCDGRIISQFSVHYPTAPATKAAGFGWSFTGEGGTFSGEAQVWGFRQ